MADNDKPKRVRAETRERKDKVLKLWSMGLRVNQISKMIGSKPSTVKADIAEGTKKMMLDTDPGILVSRCLENLAESRKLLYQTYLETDSAKVKVDSAKALADLNLRFLQIALPQHLAISHQIGTGLTEIMAGMPDQQGKIDGEKLKHLPSWQQDRLKLEGSMMTPINMPSEEELEVFEATIREEEAAEKRLEEEKDKKPPIKIIKSFTQDDTKEGQVN